MCEDMIETPSTPLAKSFTFRSLLQFAFPTILMMVFMGLYTIGDTFIISRFVNTDALSALNMITPLIQIIIGLGGMLATGGNAIIARKLGEGKTYRAAQDFTLLVISGAMLGILIAVIGCLFVDPIIWKLGASPLLFPYCKQYLFILLLFTPASMLQVLFQNLMVTAGKPSLGMVLSVSAGAINVILDYLFVVHLKMGIAGSALGTGIGYLFPTIIGILFFTRTKGSLQFQKPVIDFHVLWESSSNGFSEMISQASAAVTTFLFNIIMMELLGEDGVAAVTIMIYTQFFLTTLSIGFSMGVAPIISYNYGSKNYECLKKVFRICLLCIGIVSIFVFIMTLLFHTFFVRIFSPEGTSVYAIASQGFLIFSFSFLFCGFNIVSSATFTALSNGCISAMISTLRSFVFISILLLLLPQFLATTGVWIAVPIAELLTSFVSLVCILKYRRVYHYL